MRIGIGYDLHILAEGRKLILGGVLLDHEKGLSGHSDADVLIHAVIDALLGAASIQDIGSHFPDTDPKFKDIESRRLLRTIRTLIEEKNYKISNIDAVIIAERPKLAPHMDKIRKNLAEDLKIEIDRVSIKAKTNEGVDAVGRGEAIATHAVALLENPKSKIQNQKQIQNPKSKLSKL